MMVLLRLDESVIQGVHALKYAMYYCLVVTSCLTCLVVVIG